MVVVEKRMLLTGFDPFGGESINPALEVVTRIQGSMDTGIGVINVRSLEIPTIFGQAIEKIHSVMSEWQPHIVICVGQAGGRYQMTPERVAININDANIPDNDGQQPIDMTIVENGPAAYFSTLPLKKIVCELRSIGIPAAVSNSAGTFVCNHLFYGLMHIIATEYPKVKGGFIHIPYLPSQVIDRALPSMSLDDMTRAMHSVIKTCVNDLVIQEHTC